MSRRQKFHFCHFCSEKDIKKAIFENYFHVYTTHTQTDKSAF